MSPKVPKSLTNPKTKQPIIQILLKSSLWNFRNTLIAWNAPLPRITFSILHIATIKVLLNTLDFRTKHTALKLQSPSILAIRECWINLFMTVTEISDYTIFNLFIIIGHLAFFARLCLFWVFNVWLSFRDINWACLIEILGLKLWNSPAPIFILNLDLQIFESQSVWSLIGFVSISFHLLLICDQEP